MNDDEYVKHLKQLLLDTDYSVLEDVFKFAFTCKSTR